MGTLSPSMAAILPAANATPAVLETYDTSDTNYHPGWNND